MGDVLRALHNTDMPDATSRRRRGIRVHGTELACTSLHRLQATAVSTQFSTQTGGAAELGCCISWSQPPIGGADQYVSPAFQAGHAGSIPVARSTVSHSTVTSQDTGMVS